MREKLSVFVITHNRASLLETCLRAVSFADELIVVDKNSTDGSAQVAARYADRVEIVPWSPTVEETRAFALSLCRHDTILFLDDDEILSPEARWHLRNGLIRWDADIYSIPLRHYVLGVHDERAYYWPEAHHRLFRKGAVEFTPTVHGGVVLQSDRIAAIPPESGVCIHHLSHPDVASWMERANRYTSRPNRALAAGGEGDLIRFAHDRIDHWMGRTNDPSPDGYPAAAALLRAVYDMVDRLKGWETARGLDGAALFRMRQETLMPTTDAGRPPPHGVCLGRCAEPSAPPPPPERNEGAGRMEAARTEEDRMDPLEARGLLVRLRAAEAQSRERAEAARRLGLALDEANAALAELSGAPEALAAVRSEAREMEAALSGARTELDETRAALDAARLDLAGQRGALAGSHAEVADTHLALADALAELDDMSATLGGARAELNATRAALATAVAALAVHREDASQAHELLTHVRAELADTYADLTQSRAGLAESRAEVAAARAALAGERAQAVEITRRFEEVGGSARQFARQYWPKLRRHLARRTAAGMSLALTRAPRHGVAT